MNEFIDAAWSLRWIILAVFLACFVWFLCEVRVAPVKDAGYDRRN
jgi:hypothetical protein